MNMYEVWSKICSHQVTGLMYHFQFADMFYFLGLENLGKEQECKYESESSSLRENRYFVLKHHQKIIVSNHAEGVELIPSGWSKYTSGDIDRSTRKNQVANIFDSWIKWETQTKELYTEMYYKAVELHAVADACRIKDLVIEVERELAHAQECSNKLRMHDYSIESMLNL